jgi:3-oxoacyl-[acyl-carrier-protein] synthase II
VTDRRVVITGVGLTSPIGHSLDEVAASLKAKRHGIKPQPQWGQYSHLSTRLAAPAEGVELMGLPRKKTRTMGRLSLLSAYASDRAIADAGISAELLASGEVGLAYGSTHGSTSELEIFCRTVFGNMSLKGISSTSYLKFMSHTTAANLAMYYGIKGRIISTCAACVSASQAIGSAYEAIRNGLHDVMLCGGAEELHFTHAGVFDILFATSTHFNDQPDLSPRPFDSKRDGLVVGEGAGSLILETYERAKARGAHIHGEIIGYGTNCDGSHLTNPSSEGMAGAMRLALKDAAIATDAIDYVNAHGTATELGDIAESTATFAVMGNQVPVSSTKSYTGHTLGACGAIETAFCLAMMRDGFLAPTRNLETPDPRCGPLNYLMGDVRDAKPTTIMNNNFAFGGINTSLILRRV